MMSLESPPTVLKSWSLRVSASPPSVSRGTSMPFCASLFTSVRWKAASCNCSWSSSGWEWGISAAIVQFGHKLKEAEEATFSALKKAFSVLKVHNRIRNSDETCYIVVLTRFGTRLRASAACSALLAQALAACCYAPLNAPPHEAKHPGDATGCFVQQAQRQCLSRCFCCCCCCWRCVWRCVMDTVALTGDKRVDTDCIDHNVLLRLPQLRMGALATIACLHTRLHLPHIHILLLRHKLGCSQLTMRRTRAQAVVPSRWGGCGLALCVCAAAETTNTTRTRTCERVTVT